MSSRDPEKLIEPFRASIKKLIKLANEQGIPAFITDTTRTIGEQRELVRKGFSKTMNSKHLIGEAADIAFQINGKLSYDAKLYERLYSIAKDLPFVIWPYRDLRWLWDRPHFQYDKNKKISDTTAMDYKQLYEQEKSDHAESIKEKSENYKMWQIQLTRANTLDLENESNYTKWQLEIEARHKVETKLQSCMTGEATKYDTLKAALFNLLK